MLSIKSVHGSMWDHHVEGYVFFVGDDLCLEGSSAQKIEQDYYPHLKDILRAHKFMGKRGDSFVLTGMRENKLVQFVFVGIGHQKDDANREMEMYRRAVASAIVILKKHDITSAVMSLHSFRSVPEEKHPELIRQLSIAALMSSYEFDVFKSSKRATPWICALQITSKAAAIDAIAQALAAGVIIGQAINTTRSFADLPANIATPSYLSEEAEKIAKTYNLSYSVFGRDKATELSMGGFLAVDAGSEQEGKFVILEYKPAAKNVPIIALCGKGVTFDTGGISLKPSASMCGMKYDMSGAAAVFGTMQAIAQLKPNIHVVGLTPLVENMPSGRASRQDDIITHMNGKTTEIKNTDAEGRLILSDTLCYAEKFYNPEVIIDIATLTGAVVVGLGHFYTGLMTNDQSLADLLFDLGMKNGDRVWQLPIDDDYREGIKSQVADIANIALQAYGAGTIEAATYLQEFVARSKWAHLDIAGTAHDVPSINYVGKGATGASVRLLIDYLIARAQ